MQSRVLDGRFDNHVLGQDSFCGPPRFQSFKAFLITVFRVQNGFVKMLRYIQLGPSCILKKLVNYAESP